MAKQVDLSAQLNAAIKEALGPHAVKPLSYELLTEAKQAVGNVEAQMRSGSFGGLFVDHDIKIGYDIFGSLTWRITGKF